MAKKKAKRAAPAVKREKRVKIGKGMTIKRGEEKKLEKKPGGSNVGEYKKVGKKDFCGPSGGSPKGSYPVDSAKRCRAALSYARHAPNPSGIRECVKRKCKGKVKEFSKAKKK